MNQPTCDYEWWHTTANDRVLTRCTKPAGHDGKHEHEAAGEAVTKRRRTPIQGSGYTPFQLLGGVEE